MTGIMMPPTNANATYPAAGAQIQNMWLQASPLALPDTADLLIGNYCLSEMGTTQPPKHLVT